MLLRLVASAERSASIRWRRPSWKAAQADGLALASTGFRGHPRSRLAGDGGRAGRAGRQPQADAGQRRRRSTGWATRGRALAGAGRTVVYAAVDGQAAGMIAIADALRPTAREAVAELQQLGRAGRHADRRQPGHGRAHRRRAGHRDRLRRGAAGPEGGQGQGAAGAGQAGGDGRATASTTRPRWPRPTWASPSAPAPTWPWRPPTWC